MLYMFCCCLKVLQGSFPVRFGKWGDAAWQCAFFKPGARARAPGCSTHPTQQGARPHAAWQCAFVMRAPGFSTHPTQQSPALRGVL